DGLGAGVHHQGHLEAGDLVEVAEEKRKLVIAEGARGERDARGLLLHSGEDFRVAVALIDRRIGGEEVEIAAAADVRDPRAGSALDDDVEGMVVVGAVAVFEGDQFFGKHRDLYLRGYPSRRRPDSVARSWLSHYNYGTRLHIHTDRKCMYMQKMAIPERMVWLRFTAVAGPGARALPRNGRAGCRD